VREGRGRVIGASSTSLCRSESTDRQCAPAIVKQTDCSRRLSQVKRRFVQWAGKALEATIVD
jgi:hypothetical protein